MAQVRRLLSARYGGPGDGDPGRGNLHRGDRAGYGGGYGGYGEYGGYGGYAGYAGFHSRNLEARERLARRTPSSPASPKSGGPRTPAAVPPRPMWR